MSDASGAAGAGHELRARRPGERGDPAAGRRVLTATVALVGALTLTACATIPSSSEPSSSTPPVASEPTAPEAVPVPAPSAPDLAPVTPQLLGEGVEPASVRIPKIDLDEPLIDLGIKSDGTMGVPADWDAVGWFTGGGKPGGRGPTVIAAHVDSVTAPAVFSRLHELRPGDSVHVVDVEGTVVSYVVTEVADYPKAEFPTVRVFGARPADELRLITCGGYFDPEAASYEDNRVVFAKRA